MIFLLFSLILFSSSANGLASCIRNGQLSVYTEEISKYGFSYWKTFVNKSMPVEVMFNVAGENLDVESVTWKRDNESIVIEGTVNREIYYSIESQESNLVVTMHIIAPNSRVTGNWTMTLLTKDSVEHIAVCYIEAPPIIRPRLGAVRGNEGHPLSVTCDVETYPPPTSITWKQVVEAPNDAGQPKLIPVVNATYRSENGIQNAVLQWADATAVSGLYMCTANSPRGTDNLLFEVRIKGLKAVMWPCIGIGLELFVLLVTILLYERAQAKRRKREEAKSIVYDVDAPS